MLKMEQCLRLRNPLTKQLIFFGKKRPFSSSRKANGTARKKADLCTAQKADSMPEISSCLKLRIFENIKNPVNYEENFVGIYKPTSYRKAMTGHNAAQWRVAIHEELLVHDKNKTWTFLARPKGCTVINSRCVFKVQEAKLERTTRSRLDCLPEVSGSNTESTIKIHLHPW